MTTERWSVERQTAFLRRAGVDPETGERKAIVAARERLAKAAEEYHAGTITYEEFDRQNRASWAEIEKDPDVEVARLRNLIERALKRLGGSGRPTGNDAAWTREILRAALENREVER